MAIQSIRRHPLPRLWFLSAEERGIDARTIVPALPRGAGVIYRDYRNPERMRRARDLARRCRQRGLLLLTGGVRLPGGAGVHLPRWSRCPRRTGGPVTVSVHRASDVRRVLASRAHLCIVAPVFPTRAHPGSLPLGVVRLGLLARKLPGRVAVLGGVTPVTVRRLAGLGVDAVAGSGLFAGQARPGEFASLRVWYAPPSRRLRIQPAVPRSPTYVRLRSR